MRVRETRHICEGNKGRDLFSRAPRSDLLSPPHYSRLFSPSRAKCRARAFTRRLYCERERERERARLIGRMHLPRAHSRERYSDRDKRTESEETRLRERGEERDKKKSARTMCRRCESGLSDASYARAPLVDTYEIFYFLASFFFYLFLSRALSLSPCTRASRSTFSSLSRSHPRPSLAAVAAAAATLCFLLCSPTERESGHHVCMCIRARLALHMYTRSRARSHTTRAIIVLMPLKSCQG